MTPAKLWAIATPLITAILGAIVSSLIARAGSASVRAVAAEVAKQECSDLISMQQKTYLQGVRDGSHETITELKKEQQANPMPLGKLIVKKSVTKE
jgi:hypothetical protein